MSHRCHASYCDRPTDPRLLMCPQHWRKVPRLLQLQVLRHYRPGQEVTKSPSLRWTLAAYRAVIAVAQAEKIESPRLQQMQEFIAAQERRILERLLNQKTIKVLTLWEPWATLMLLGIKGFETRDWYTSYRGPLVIQAAKRPLDEDGLYLIQRLQDKGFDIPQPHKYPFGKLLTLGTLGDCIPMALNDDGDWLDHKGRVPEVEELCGNWDEGRYAWEFQDCFPLPEPLLIRGYQGLWNLPEEYRLRIRAQFGLDAPSEAVPAAIADETVHEPIAAPTPSITQLSLLDF